MASIPRTSPDARLIAAAADLLARQAGAVIDPTSAAEALHAAGMLQSPETSAELAELRARLEGIRSQASDAAAAWIDAVDGRPIAQAAPPAADLAATSALDSLIDEYGRADTAPLGDMRELRMKLEAIRREATAATEARVAELETQRERRRIRLIALDNDAQEIRGILSPNGEARKVPMPLGETLAPAVEWLVNRVAELEAQAATARADALTEAAGIVNDTVHLFPDTSEYAAAKGALEGLAIRLRRLDAAPSPQPGTPEHAAGAEQLLALAAAEGKPDNRRRIYIDGKGNAWIDAATDPVTGEQDIVGITDPWKLKSAAAVRDETGDLREIGRCW
ncbi:MAG TPA: hypothetical protein VGF17_29105 [Phytomonospora sp.]